MLPNRVAVIFDNEVRPDTTGIYCLRALQSLTGVHHIRPQDLSAIPTNQFDLYLRIDDGLDYELPSRLRPRAWWIIDSHLSLPWYLQQVNAYDSVFVAQRDAVQAFYNHCSVYAVPCTAPYTVPCTPHVVWAAAFARLLRWCRCSGVGHLHWACAARVAAVPAF